MRNKKAFMLIEMLLIIAMFATVMMLSVGPMQTFFHGILGTHKAFDRQGTLEMILDQLREDTENADFAFVHPAGLRLGGDMLYLSGSRGVVCYQFADETVTRIKAQDSQQWAMPRIKFDWRLLALSGDVQAVTMTTYQQRKSRGTDLPAFRGSQLFVVNLYGNFPLAKD